MESKLNIIAIQEYSEDLADIFLDEADPSKSYFTGKDILKINEVKQVNLFILRQIFFSWIKQSKDLKSPYFDFENKDVEKAMTDFMNTLSHHISVPRDLMKELYSNAICDTILFYLVPDYFLNHFFNELDDSMLSMDTLKRLKTYIDLNRKMYVDFLEKAEKEKLDVRDREQLHKLVNSISFDAEEKDIFDYFSSKKELDVESFLNIEEDQKEETPKTEFKEGKQYSFDNEAIVHEKYKTDKETLNDKLSQEKTPSLADSMRKQKINSIANSISVNQRFIFVKELFGGNLDNYQRALDKLDHFETWEEANEFIEEKIAAEYNWDISKDSVADFTDIVERKFR